MMYQLDALYERVKTAAAAQLEERPKPARVSHVKGAVEAATAVGGDIAAVLELIPNADEHWKIWRDTGLAVFASSEGSAEGLELFHMWSAKSRKYDAGTTDQAWADFTRSPPSRVGFGSLFYRARLTDPGFRKPSDIALDPPALEDPAQLPPGSSPGAAGEPPPLRLPQDDDAAGSKPGDGGGGAAGRLPPPAQDGETIEPKGVGPFAFIVDTAAPLQIAELYTEVCYRRGGQRTLHYHRGVFHAWNGAAYPPLEMAALRTGLYRFLEQCGRLGKGDRLLPVNPGPGIVNVTRDALQAVAFLSEDVTAPCWLDLVPDLAAGEIVACNNGLLYLPTRELLPHTPLFYTENALELDYRPRPPAPWQWLRFLRQLWPDDRVSRRTLQEIFGYLLTADTRQQKAFMVIGPRRSGKGTIGRLLTRLVGVANTVSPTLSSLGMNFGLAPLIGKRLALISDARLGGRADQHFIVERLLSISGEDSLTIDRKYLPAWTGRLQTRFLVLTNEIPKIADASGVLASRFIVLILRESFYGREDHHLSERLIGELPGILHWALRGRDRLARRGFFRQPASAAEAIRTFEDLGSPITTFVREKCTVEPGAQIEIAGLFKAWLDWCEAQGRKFTGDSTIFGRDLRAVLPTLHAANLRRPQGGRRRVYQGLRLKTLLEEWGEQKEE